MAGATLAEQQQQDNRRTGALACIMALHELEQIAEGANDPDHSVDEQYRQMKLACEAVTGAAQPLNPYMDGFVSTLAQYIFDVHTAGNPNLKKWKSLAAMTPSQIAAQRKQIEEVCHG